MANDLISKTTRRAFREWLVGTCLRYIEGLFNDAGIACDESFIPKDSGERRVLVEQYYHSLDWTNPKHIQQVLSVYANNLIAMEEEDRAKFEKILERDHYHFDGSKILPTQDKFLCGDRLYSIAEELNLDIVYDQIGRLQEAAISDPALAIGTSKELLESICKGIAHGNDIDLKGNEDLPALVKLCLKSLHMAREDITDDKRGADARKQIASGLAAACQGIAELRNIYGTGHGKGPNAERALARDAHLAVGTSVTLGGFLAEVFMARQQHDSLDQEHTSATEPVL